MAYESKRGKLKKKSKETKALELVKSRFNISEKYTQPYFTRFQDYYTLYRSYLQTGRLPWRSNLFIPKTFEIVETIAPRIAQAQKTFKTLPVEGMDVDNSEAYTDLLKFQFQKTNMESIIEEWVKETLIYGTGVVKVTWGADDMPNPEVVDIYDFFIDPKARFLEEAKYVIHRVMRDIDDLESNPNYDKKTIEKLKKAYADKKSASDSPDRLERLSISGTSAEDSSRMRFEVLEYWGKFDDGDGMKDYLIVVADGELLRCDENPYASGMPFVAVRDQIIPHEFYGIGEIEPVESLQNEINDVRNQRMDNVKLNLNNMWKVLPGGVQFEDELVSRPGGVIHMTRQDGVVPLEKQPIDSSAFTEESIIKSDMERTTGANSAMSGALVSPMGGNTGGVINRTATAYQGAINQGDKRFNGKINQIKIGLIKVGRKFLELDQQFMDKETAIRILGKDGEDMLVPVLPEDIKAGFDLDIEIEYLDEFQRMQQDTQIIQAMANVPGFNLPLFMIDSLKKNGRKDVEKYMMKPEPPKPDEPKVNLQLKGDVMPDAVAQILEKKEGVKSHPDLVASRMRMEQAEESIKEAEINNQSTL